MKVEKLVEHTALQLFLWALRLAGWQICSCVHHYRPQRGSICLSQGETLIKASCCSCVLNAQKLEFPACGDGGGCLDRTGFSKKASRLPRLSMCEFCDGAAGCRGSEGDGCLGGFLVQLLARAAVERCKALEHCRASSGKKLSLGRSLSSPSLLPTRSCTQVPRDSCVPFANERRNRAP